MCGIAGIINFNKCIENAVPRLHLSLKELHHRGPDFSGTYLSPHVLFGHTRLAILDTSSLANQPFTDVSGNYTIVFNGEIYNFKQLKEQLEKKGYVFHTSSDTEVLLNLYIDEGINCLNKLNGDFAFAIFDKPSNKVVIARDRLGVKPLYYKIEDCQFSFSSELKGLLPLLDKKPELSEQALLLYLQLNYIPAPLSVFRSVYKLEPGKYIVVNAKNIEVNEYYSIPKGVENNISEHEAIQHFRSLLIASVQKRLISDVPIGCFLSGGLDSSIVAAIAKQTKPDLNTFTIGFSENSFVDESNDAEKLARHIGTKHHTIKISESDLLQLVPDVLQHIDEPFADSSAIAVSALAKYTKNHITVALSGDGADELMGGYYKHYAHKLAFSWYPYRHLMNIAGKLLRTLPQSRTHPVFNKIRQFNRFTKGVRLPAEYRYWYWATTQHEKDLKLLLTSGYSAQNINNWLKTKAQSMNEVLYNDLHLVLPNDMLYKTDFMSMMHSLEVRVPMLDHELVNFVAVLPEQFKIKGKEQKIILKRAFGHLLPEELLKKPKHGFEVPLQLWLSSSLKPLLDEYLQASFLQKQELFNDWYIQQLVKQLNSANPSDSAIQLWNLLVFQFWWKKIYS